MKAIRMHQLGGPEVLRYEDAPNPTPGRGQAVVDLKSIGVNFTDIYTRRGPNPPPSLPLIPGREGAGIVSAVGEGVTEVAVGDAVAYYAARGAPGTYAEKVVAPSARLVKLPQGVTMEMGAAVMLQGMTAHFLCYSICQLNPGMKVLVHAGAGGTGLLLIQMAKQRGAYVYTTVSTDEKARLATEAGADHAIIYTRQDFLEEVKKATGGEGVQVVYDSVGMTTLEKSLACLARRGYLVSFGQASGPAPVLQRGMARGSILMTSVAIDDFTTTREELFLRAGALMEWLRSGSLKLHIHKTYPLSEVSQAHRDLEGRETAGKLLLTP